MMGVGGSGMTTAPVRTATGRRAGPHPSIGLMTDTPGEAARFLTRNAVDALPQGELERQLEKGRPLRVKLGVDPTTPDIHLGHTVVLRKLREFQELGHTVVLIIGDYTGRVGDPSGRSAMRPFVEGEEIDRNAQTYQEQAFKVLDRDRTEVRRNGEWLDMSMEDLFRLARTATAAQILERDDFSKRYAAGEPISILELLYPLLQEEPGPDPREAKRHMAFALTERYHGPEAAEAARERFDTLHVRRELPDEVEEFAFSDDNGLVHVPGLLAAAFGLSRSEGRRLIAQGGVKLAGDDLSELDVPAERLDGAVIQVGRRRFKKLRRG